MRQRFPDDRILCPDLPGNGSLYDLESPRSVAEAVEAYRRYCRESGISGPYQLLGLSMGGMAALSWLASYPDEVERAVAINTSVAGQNISWQRFRPAALVRLLPSIMTVASRERAILELTTNLQHSPDSVLMRWLDIAERQPLKTRNALRQIVAAKRFRMSRPNHPERITMVVSLGDRLVSPHCSQSLSRLWGLNLICHESAGHDLPLDAPEWLLDRLAGLVNVESPR